MNWLYIVGLIVFLLFSFVTLFGAPFLPTLNAQTTEALDLLDLKPGQTLTELGSGDGRILRAAARRGIYAIGYELNPVLVIWSRLASWRYRRLITVHWGNYWRHSLPLTDGIYVFLLQSYMKKLDTKIIQEAKKPIKLVSYAFQIPNKKHSKLLNGLYLYSYKIGPPKTKIG